MAFGFFMNMERISLDIAKEHLNNMTADNTFDDIDCFLDDDKIENNMKNGFVVITQLNVFIESFLNTILNSCIECNSKELLKTSIDEKLEIIFLYYGKDLSKIKSMHQWGVFKEIIKVRNEMVHFKKTFIGEGTGIPDFCVANIQAKIFFTKEYMEKAMSQVIQLGDLIADELGLKVCRNIGIFHCDAKDGLVNYVYDASKVIGLDETIEE